MLTENFRVYLKHKMTKQHSNMGYGLPIHLFRANNIEVGDII